MAPLLELSGSRKLSYDITLITNWNHSRCTILKAVAEKGTHKNRNVVIWAGVLKDKTTTALNPSLDGIEWFGLDKYTVYIKNAGFVKPKT
jgi:hypothetical protein